jgi:hypothetical protein
MRKHLLGSIVTDENHYIVAKLANLQTVRRRILNTGVDKYSSCGGAQAGAYIHVSSHEGYHSTLSRPQYVILTNSAGRDGLHAEDVDVA